jgi:Tol biopolymer transport system component
MTFHDDDLGRVLSPWFRQTAPEREPDGLLKAVLTRTAQTKRRPRWRIADTWRPDVAMPRPVALPRRALWLAVTVPLIIALTLGLVAIGSQRRLPPPFGPARAGLVVFDSGGHIVAAASDGTGRRVLTSGGVIDSSPSWSLDGRKIAFWRRHDVGLPASLWVMNGDGSAAHDVTGDEDFGGSEHFRAVWSPDSKRIAFSVGDYYSSAHVYVVGADGSDLHEVGGGDLARSDPAWSPDGRLIAFRGHSIGVLPDAYPPDSAIGVYVAAPDGSGQRRISGATGAGGMPNYSAFGGPIVSTSPSWSPDGTTLTYSTGTAGDLRIAIRRLDGSAERILPLPGGDDLMPIFSPDGTRIAFVTPTDPAGYVADGYVVGADGRGLELLPIIDQVAVAAPTWSPDGASIVLLSRDEQGLVVVDVTGPARVAGTIVTGDPIETNSPYMGTFQRASWQRLAP